MTDEAKKRAGRPPVAGTNTRKVSVTLDAETLAELERLGGGNLSAGVRRAAAGQADAESLRAALAPFAALLGEHHRDESGDRLVFAINRNAFTVGDLRRAVAALQRAGM